MGVQTKILTRMFTGTVAGPEGEKNYSVKSAALVGGVPGQIYDVAFGPVVHTTNLTAAAEIGTFVAGHGVIINAPEYALYGAEGAPLAPSLKLPANTVVSVMTAGHVWVKRSALAAIKAGMNTTEMYVPEGTAADDICVVEVNGLVPANEESPSHD